MTEVDRRLRVCFIALNAYPVIDSSAGRAVGGLEARAWNLATGLSRQPGVEVYFMVAHTHLPATKSVEGVTLVPIVERLRDIRFDVSRVVERIECFPWCRLRDWNRNILWQLPLLLATRAFRDRRPIQDRIPAHCAALLPDVCIGFGLGAHSAAVVRAARDIQRPSIVALASNADLDREFVQDTNFVNQYGDTASDARYVVEHASVVVCQTPWQQNRLRELTSRESFLLPTPIRLDEWSRPTREAVGEYVLWIGRYDEVYKRPQLCLQIARLCPEIQFIMVINRGDADVERRIRRDATSNIRIIDYVPRGEMQKLFHRSKIFLSTGQSEGFPNVFLEAAATATPLVTLEDFGDFVAQSGSGICTNGDVPQSAAMLQQLWNAPERCRVYSENGERWVHQFHSLEAVSKNLRKIIDATCGTSSRTNKHIGNTSVV